MFISPCRWYWKKAAIPLFGIISNGIRFYCVFYCGYHRIWVSCQNFVDFNFNSYVCISLYSLHCVCKSHYFPVLTFRACTWILNAPLLTHRFLYCLYIRYKTCGLFNYYDLLLCRHFTSVLPTISMSHEHDITGECLI